MVYAVLRVIHLVFMATWFGAGLFQIRDVRTALAAGPEHVPLLRQRMRVIGIVTGASGLITVLSGLGLVFALGGFGSVPPGIHAGLLLGLLTLAAGTGGIGGTWRKMDAALASGAAPASVAPMLKRLGMFSGMFQGFWLLTLLAMVFRAGLG